MMPGLRPSRAQLLQFAQRLRHALLALTRGAPARRDDPRAGLRQLARHFLRQRGDLRACFLQAALQRAATVERGLAGVVAHPSRFSGRSPSRPALPWRSLIASSTRPSSTLSSTRQIARAGCSASSSPSRSVGCRISCLRLASRSRTASSITAPPPLHLPPYHPYSTTLLRSLRLKKSQTRRMTE